MSNVRAKLGNLLRSSEGFTLVELLVGILSSAMSFVGRGAFQAFSADSFRQDTVMAAAEVRKAGTWFAGDAVNAETTDLIDAAAPVSSVTLSWTDRHGVPKTVLYQIAGGTLTRTEASIQTTVARGVVSGGFQLSGKLVMLDIGVQGASGGTENAVLQTYLRMMQ